MFGFSKNFRFKDLHFGTDMHSHILPSVDDGFKKQESSLRAMEALKAMGIDNFILTPHINPEFYPQNTPAFIRKNFELFSSSIEGLGVSCRVAGEHMVYPGFEDYLKERKDNTDEDALLLLPDGRMLIEMSYAFVSQNIKDVIFYLNFIGVKPILAHPERYVFYPVDEEGISDLKSMDCRFQLNLLSLTGYYGKPIKERAEIMLENGLYSYAGTDLHGLSQTDVLRSLAISKKHLSFIEKIIEGNASLLG